MSDSQLKDDKRELQAAEFKGSSQLELFMIGGTASQSAYSNLIDVYDVLPKFCYDKKEVSDIKDTEIIRTITIKGEAITVSIEAAMLTNENNERVAVFAGEREEFVEEALRKIATSGRAELINDRTGMQFTLYELQKELIRTKHTYSIDQIKEALLILRKTSISCKSNISGNIFSTNLIDQIVLTNNKEWQADPNQKCIVRFNAMVHDAIFSLGFRQYNYELSMSIKSALGRYIYKRMCQFWTQASDSFPYTPSLNSFLKQSPKKLSARTGDNMRAMNKALDELIKCNVVSSYEANKEIEGKRKIIDVRYVIYPHQDFIKDIKRANRIQSDTKSKANKLQSMLDEQNSNQSPSHLEIEF